MKIKLNDKNLKGLTEVNFDGEHFRAYDSVARHEVPVDHIMSEAQKKRVKKENA